MWYDHLDNRRVIKNVSYDEDCEADWDKPENLGLVQLGLNEVPHTQTGVSTLAATFGELDAKYFDIPEYKDGSCSHPYVQRLGELLGKLRATS